MAHRCLRRPVGVGRAPTQRLCAVHGTHAQRIGKQGLILPCQFPFPVKTTKPFSSQPRGCGFRPVVAQQASAGSSAGDVMERKRSRLQIDTSPEIIEGPEARELPMPSEYQQTLWSSFALSGIGLHTGEYACVRVRPAFAGEGRYFVRVPEGTNQHIADATMNNELELPVETPEDEEAALSDPEYRLELIERYREYVEAQVEDGFQGSFVDYLNGQNYTDLLQRLRDEGPPRYQFSEPEALKPRSPSEPYVLATAAYIWEANPVTTSLVKGDLQVVGVEALLSALEACGVDNARIEIEGGTEVPVLDGSAEGWVREICTSGVRYAPSRPDLKVPGVEGLVDKWRAEAARRAAQEAAEGEEDAEPFEEVEEIGQGEQQPPELQPTPKFILRPQQVISVCRGASFVTLYPEDNIRLTVGLDRHIEAPVIGKQWLSWSMFEDVHYKVSIAEARGFVASPQQAMGMRESGWLQGGTEGVMLIGYGERWYDPQMVRFENEPVRHQMQDLIGDMALLSHNGHSGMPLGHIVAYNADHQLYAEFLRQLIASTSEADWVPLRNIAGPSVPLDYKELMDSVMGEDDEDEEGGEGERGMADGEQEEGAQAAVGDVEEDEDEDELGYDEDEEEDEVEEGIVDVEADVGPSRGRGGSKGRR